MNHDLRDAEVPILCWTDGDETVVRKGVVKLAKVKRPCLLTSFCPVSGLYYGVWWRHSDQAWYPLGKYVHPQHNDLSPFRSQAKLPATCILPEGYESLLPGSAVPIEAQGFYEISREGSGVVVRLRTAQNGVLLMGERLPTEMDAQEVVCAIRSSCESADRYELIQDAESYWFQLKAMSRRTLGTSFRFPTVPERARVIADVKRCGRSRIVRDLL